MMKKVIIVIAVAAMLAVATAVVYMYVGGLDVDPVDAYPALLYVQESVPDIDYAVLAEDGKAIGIFMPSPGRPICK